MRQRGFRRVEPHFPRWVWCLRGHFVCVGGELAWPHEGQNLWLCWKVLGVRTHPKPLHPALLRSNVRKGDRIHSEVCAAAVINQGGWLCRALMPLKGISLPKSCSGTLGSLSLGTGAAPACSAEAHWSTGTVWGQTRGAAQAKQGNVHTRALSHARANKHMAPF